MRTVLVFAYECAPHHGPAAAIAAQRPAGLARHLGASGWRAVIVACDGGRRRVASRRDLPAIAADARRAIRESDPRAPLVIATPSLASDGALDAAWWRLVGARPGSAAAGLRRALTVLRWTSGDHSRSWQPCAEAAAEAVAAETHVDACLAEHSPDAGLFLAARFARRHGVPWGADFRDPILRPLGPLARRLYAPVARGLLTGAAFTVAVNPHWRDLDERILRRPAACIPNGFEPAEFSGPDPGRDPARLVVAYMGNVLGDQDPRPFLAGLALLRRERGADASPPVLFRYRGGQHESIRALAAEEGVADAVDAGPPIPRPEALRALRAADVLLLLSMPPSSRRDPMLARGLYPGKTFEYFGARRPILCVPGDGDLLDSLVGETRTGAVRADARGVAGFLAEALTRRARGEDLPYAPDEDVVAAYARPAQVPAFAALLDRSLGASGGGVAAGRPAEAPAPGKRRVLMLVNNSVRFDQRVRRHASALAAAGHRVTVLGTTAPGEDPSDVEPIPGAELRWVRRDPAAGVRGRWNRVASGLVSRAAAGAWAAGVRLPGIADRAVAPTLALLRSAARSIPADVVYAHDLHTLPAATRVARGRRAPVVYDAHEWYAGERLDLPAGAVEAIGAAERRGVGESAAVVTVSPGVAARLAGEYGCAPVIVRNLPPPGPSPGEPEVPPRGTPLRVLYHSAHLSLDGRRLRDLVDAVAAQDGRVHLRLRGGVVHARERELLDYLRDRLPPASWSLHPPLAWAAMQREASRSDVGVVLNSPAVENEALTLPNKVFEYMAAGLAVLAYRTDAVAAVVEDAGAGVVTERNDVASLAAALRAMEEDRPRVREQRRRARAAAVRDHDWTAESRILERVVDGLPPAGDAP